jgi:hypothetical protein
MRLSPKFITRSRDGAWGVLYEAEPLVCKKNIHDRAYLSIGVTSSIGAGLCRVPGGGGQVLRFL